METTPKGMHPELLRILEAFSGSPANQIKPSDHVVFDLGVEGSDVDALIGDIESHFHFIGTDAEWRSARIVGDIDELVVRLQGKERPEVSAERDAQAAVVRRRNRIVIGVVCGWLGVGALTYLTSPQGFKAWVIITLCVALFSLSRSYVRVAGARRRWKRERLAKYGV